MFVMEKDKVHIEDFDFAVNKHLFKPGERYDDPKCGVLLTFIERPNTAGTLQSCIDEVVLADGKANTQGLSLILGDQSEVRMQFKDANGKPMLVKDVKFGWASHPDYTAEDAKQDAIDFENKRIVFAEPIRMELRREGKAYAWSNYSPPVSSLSNVSLAGIELDEILFTTSRRGKVWFDNFNWKPAV
ncbi:hypothetical protein [Pseudomonas sp. zfem002]|uniref:hypothetical protein n=1 Tax=Pseudomonas sp. zfem002 TaxID=3078197 RepID=UPI0029289220|nr:hypothetical protein [Pseudomonas sp. zfem002]MDU9391627.1 hypothetical protein [Pseudomonas sp. zfem002]